MSKLVVAFDTATDAVAMGLGRIDGVSLEVVSGGYEIAPRNSNTRLLALLVERLAHIGADPSDIEAVVCGRGPGSFTGVRIGVATAKGLAQGLGMPLVGVGTLDAVAWALAASGEAPDGYVIAVVGDAMRGEVYPALFDVVEGRPARRAADRVAAPEAVAQTWVSELEGRDVILVGNGLRKYADRFTAALPDAVVADEAAWWPSGEGLLNAFVDAGGEGLLADADPAVLLPVYTRLSDAEEAERVRLGQTTTLPDNGVSGPAAAPSGAQGGEPT